MFNTVFLLFFNNFNIRRLISFLNNFTLSHSTSATLFILLDYFAEFNVRLTSLLLLLLIIQNLLTLSVIMNIFLILLLLLLLLKC